MANEELVKVNDLFESGMKGADIARELNIPYNTVKSYLRRKKVQVETKVVVVEKEKCKCCGNPIDQPIGKKHKDFCCDYCRVKYWRKEIRCQNKSLEMK